MTISGSIFVIAGESIKKLMKRDYINIGIIITIFLSIVIFLVGSDYVYGSTTDWQIQHWAFPEFFRNLFYDTKNILPNFAFNLGGGQNIYYFSYYGLLSPIILISYLLPFIPMPYYIMISSIIVIIISIILLYKWLYKGFDSNISFISTMLFMLSGPLIFHSHRHIMFMNYMPFLIMGLIGVDKYFNGKRTLLIISVFLIIMTSYYYSVGSIIAILLYYIYKYIELNKLDYKIIVNTFKFILNIFISILMASILLWPTAYVILTGREATNTSVDYLSLFIPTLNYSIYLYRAYSLGLTSIFMYSLVDNFIYKEKHNQLLSFIFGLFLLFPILLYLLNGLMYVESKALIPFLPLAILLIANTLNRIYKLNYNNKKTTISFIIVTIVMVWNLISNNHDKYIYDFIIFMIAFILFNKYKKIVIIAFPLILFAFNNNLEINRLDKLVTKDLIDMQLKNINELSLNNQNLYRFGDLKLQTQNINRINNINNYQASIYSSTNNLYYNNFYFEEFGNEITYRNNLITPQPKNILFNMYMGIKYLIGDDLDIIGYNKENGIYVNNDVLPIGYAKTNLINIYDYEKLVYPYNIEAILNNVVVNKEVSNNYISNIDELNFNYELISDNVKIENNNKVYSFTSGNDGLITINLDKPIIGEVLMFKFDMLYNQNCSRGDVLITVNGITNKLTCKQWKYHNQNHTFEYSISSNEPITNLTMNLTKGKYEIGNIKFYTLSYDNLKSIKDNIDEFVFDNNLTKGDHIEGNINVTNDGYFVLNIPYDKGFNIYVDNELINYELVNKSFIGFDIKKGYHNIKIDYKSPYLDISKYLSILGLGMFLIVIYKDKKSM